MPTDLSQPETYLFSFQYQGATYVVGIAAEDHATACAMFASLSPARKRALALARTSSARERDHVAELGTWLRSFFRREARSAAR